MPLRSSTPCPSCAREPRPAVPGADSARPAPKAPNPRLRAGADRPGAARVRVRVRRPGPAGWRGRGGWSGGSACRLPDLPGFSFTLKFLEPQEPSAPPAHFLTRIGSGPRESLAAEEGARREEGAGARPEAEGGRAARAGPAPPSRGASWGARGRRGV